MRIDIISVIPEMLEGFFNHSILARAQNKGLAEIHVHNSVSLLMIAFQHLKRSESTTKLFLRLLMAISLTNPWPTSFP